MSILRFFSTAVYRYYIQKFIENITPVVPTQDRSGIFINIDFLNPRGFQEPDFLDPRRVKSADFTNPKGFSEVDFENITRKDQLELGF